MGRRETQGDLLEMVQVLEDPLDTRSIDGVWMARRFFAISAIEGKLQSYQNR